MASKIEDELQRMLETITINAHYPRYIKNLNILVEYEFYFDICQIIFPWFNIKLIKIKENEELTPGQKMQKLIELLSHQLQIDLSSIKGEEIIKSHILHVHHFLQVLQKFSQHYLTNSLKDSGSRRAKSDPNTSQRVDQIVNPPRSAREKVPKNIPYEAKNQQLIISNKESNKKPKNLNGNYSADKKQERNHSEVSKNLYSSLVKIMMKQKNRTMIASGRDNRKIKNQQIIEAKNKYKAYLFNYAKQNRASKKRDTLVKNKNYYNVEKPLPMQDFFKSFEYKLRDQKYCYLKRLEKLIKSQEIDRMCCLNKIEQQKNKQVKKSTKKELDRIENEHRIRNDILKQEFEKSQSRNKLMKKQYEKYLRAQKKELHENKKKELKKIKDFMEQENQKVLVNLEEGGRLQQIIFDMYKRF